LTPQRSFLFAAVSGLAFMGLTGSAFAQLDTMAKGQGSYSVPDPLFTVGESFGSYTPPGILDGLGAYALDGSTVRVLANHELLHFRGYPYAVNSGAVSLTGARVSYFDIDVSTRQVVASGLAYDTVYDANGDVPTDTSFLGTLSGFSRFCSSALFEGEEFGAGRGITERAYFTGEEDGGNFNAVGGFEWVLDPATKSFWALPDFGRGAWENVTQLDTGNSFSVAFLLADDTSPFDADGDGQNEAAPLYLYVGLKSQFGDFPARNGLRGGRLYVWVADDPTVLTPTQFNGTGATVSGRWVQIDNRPDGTPSVDGSTGFDLYGYPTQSTLWTRAETLGAFGFSRPEDLATNPDDGSEAVLASTGVDTYENGVDTFGTTYTIRTDFSDLSADITILYDGDADPRRRLRSPDNLDWADDGFIYVQEDEAEEDTLNGEPLFGPGAANPREAGIVRLDPNGTSFAGVARIDRSVVLDASLADPTQAVDVDAGQAGEWESSGILDVSSQFGEAPGRLFLFDVQAHGIEDQTNFNPMSMINDNDLVEGGQLLFLERN